MAAHHLRRGHSSQHRALVGGEHPRSRRSGVLPDDYHCEPPPLRRRTVESFDHEVPMAASLIYQRQSGPSSAVHATTWRRFLIPSDEQRYAIDNDDPVICSTTKQQPVADSSAQTCFRCEGTDPRFQLNSLLAYVVLRSAKALYRQRNQFAGSRGSFHEELSCWNKRQLIWETLSRLKKQTNNGVVNLMVMLSCHFFMEWILYQGKLLAEVG
ncbi:hypothetical protein M6B38_369475 [Iris pallida]|uniref:Uncharacterized protein n=1 Tax=Iris pallida TaxID=29817 RepID=A0AAX6GDX5_IRIPA|nr:hypothetical protein M6B38_369475 [Iris pallida]